MSPVWEGLREHDCLLTQHPERKLEGRKDAGIGRGALQGVVGRDRSKPGHNLTRLGSILGSSWVVNSSITSVGPTVGTAVGAVVGAVEN